MELTWGQFEQIRHNQLVNQAIANTIKISAPVSETIFQPMHGTKDETRRKLSEIAKRRYAKG